MQPNNSMFPALSAVPSINLRPEVLISRESQRQSKQASEQGKWAGWRWQFD
jgi:hypothetical protein